MMIAHMNQNISETKCLYEVKSLYEVIKTKSLYEVMDFQYFEYTNIL